MTTTIDQVSYAYVENGRPAPTMHLHDVGADLVEYLAGHVDTLRSRATIAPHARFRDDDGRARFAALARGGDDFLVAAQELATAVFTAMDGRMKPGFIVAMRVGVDDPATPAGVVLKLDVTESAGAAIERSGDEPTLEGVAEMLDVPGALQKGCIALDARPGSDAVVSDRQTQPALYFVRALGLRQSAAPERALVDLAKVVEGVAPNRGRAVTEAMATEPGPVTLPAFLDRHTDLLTDEQRTRVLEKVADLPRPIDEIDPEGGPITETLLVDGIKVSGPLDVMTERVDVVPHEGAYRIVIDVSAVPRRQYS